MVGTEKQQREQLKLSQQIGERCRALPGFSGIIVGESFTGGAILSALIAVPGASEYVLGGIVFYNPALKAALGLKDVEQVSAEFAEKSAKALLSYSQRHYKISPSIVLTSTGYAGPTGKEGLYFIGIATSGSNESRTFEVTASGDDQARRSFIRGQGVIDALKLLLSTLL